MSGRGSTEVHRGPEGSTTIQGGSNGDCKTKNGKKGRSNGEDAKPHIQGRNKRRKEVKGVDMCLMGRPEGPGEEGAQETLQVPMTGQVPTGCLSRTAAAEGGGLYTGLYRKDNRNTGLCKNNEGK